MAEPTEQDITTPSGETIHISVSDADATPAEQPDTTETATPTVQAKPRRRGHYNQATGEFTIS